MWTHVNTITRSRYFSLQKDIGICQILVKVENQSNYKGYGVFDDVKIVMKRTTFHFYTSKNKM